MNRPGDWNCLSCSHLNFQRRESCQRCREPRPGSISDLVSGFASRPISNAFAFNTGPDCGAAKDESSRSAAAGFLDMNDGPRRGLYGFGSTSGGGGGMGRSPWKSGDWICPRPGCNEHNFASRSECFTCNAPREPVTNIPPY
ncbi:unnamed protein product [Eruca vesicaria subsp. sativa]|uniref:RanBP2-type domain-containing protein n=1 Tax=Eruca vesicaria subsp. sativa TaxID=29727 RepID=A0ABC8JAG7_ERUVS|nr:unnamed protein product [Eruca vesicaria subsp. sativa]